MNKKKMRAEIKRLKEMGKTHLILSDDSGTLINAPFEAIHFAAKYGDYPTLRITNCEMRIITDLRYRHENRHEYFELHGKEGNRCSSQSGSSSKESDTESLGPSQS